MLEAGPLFHVHITSTGGNYCTSFNNGTLPVVSKLDTAKLAAEREIIKRVREMLPAYRIIFERQEKRPEIVSRDQRAP